jgi:malate dehydrogenase (oxaloacetate-decarboxylating)
VSSRPRPSASFSATLRVHLDDRPGAFAELARAIADAGGNLGAIDLVRVESGKKVRDITVDAASADHIESIVAAVRMLPGIEVEHVSDRTFLLHLGGKIEVASKAPLKTRDDLSMAYTPGVARVCRAIAEDPAKVWNLTIKQNTVAVVTDGTAVLGLGDIGPEAAMPVMEGKAMLFKEFGSVDAWPICLATKDVDEIVAAVAAIAPGFGGINLEDISAPRCFEIESRLKESLDIPVFHDDQHGTAVVTLAAFLNALRLVGKQEDQVRVVLTGVGAAGVATTDMLLAAGVRDIIGCDRHGALHLGRDDLGPWKQAYAERTNPEGFAGSADEALGGADVFVGLSGPGAVSRGGIASMADGAIVFAMANPTPEVAPEEIEGLAAVVATGRSDYPNQINNVLAFPGIFRRALDVRASEIN